MKLPTNFPPMKNFSAVFSFFLLFLFANANCQSNTLKTWDVYEIELKASSTFQNPYLECLKEGEKAYATAKFTGTSGPAVNKSYEVPGFWDGKNTWKFRFTPPFSGSWKYETVSADKGLNKKKGVINVSDWTEDEKNLNPTRRGFILVNKKEPNPGRYFVYSDGTPATDFFISY